MSRSTLSHLESSLKPRKILLQAVSDRQTFSKVSQVPECREGTDGVHRGLHSTEILPLGHEEWAGHEHIVVQKVSPKD